jgi:nitroreductase
MDLFEAIDKRHSYRDDYQDKPVPREDLQKIVEAGIKAPSGCNVQRTTFVIVDDSKLLEEIRKLHGMRAVQTAKAIIFCVIPTDPSPAYGKMTFEVEDCSAATENILLAVTALGYATVWIDGQLREESRAEKFNKLLGVPKGHTCRIMLPIGVPATAKKRAAKKPFAKRAFFNRHQ